MFIADAVRTLAHAIKHSEGFRETWKSNIAVAVQDAYNSEPNKLNIQKISNEGADRFLDILIADVEKNDPK